MKKFLACLMACLMLFSCAWAENYAVEIDLDIPSDAIIGLLAALAEAFPETAGTGEMLEDAQWKGVAKLIDGLGLQCLISSDGTAGTLSLEMGGSVLLEANCDTTGSTERIMLDVLPDVVFEMPLNQEAADAQALFDSTDWTQLGSLLNAAVEDWYYTLDGWVEEGAFAGEAYTAGIYRIVSVFDDRDLYMLAEDILHYSDELAHYRKIVTQILDDYLMELGVGMNGEALLEELRKIAFNAAEENAYSYTLYEVDDGYNLTGVTLLAEKNGVQVASLSIGYPAHGFKAVLGYGYQGGNVYLTLDSADGVNWSAAMVKDEERAGLYSAKAEAANRLLEAQWKSTNSQDQSTLDVTLTGALLNGLTLRMNYFMDLGIINHELLTRFYINDSELLTVKTSVKLTQDELKPLDVQDCEVVRFDENGFFAMDDQKANEMLTTLSVRIFKALPTELLMMMVNMPSIFE